MGYSNRPNAITQVKPFLDEMLNTEEEIVWLSKEPDKFRYSLHQALNAAVMLAAENSEYLPYARLKSKFKIRAEGTKVIASPTKSTFLEAINYVSQSRMPFRGISEQTEIIAMLAKHNSSGELIFNFEGPRPELDLAGLYKVAQKYKYHMIPSSTSLVFSKSADDEDMAWTPEDE